MIKGKILKTLAIAGTCLCAPLLLSGCGKEDDKFYITFMANGETYKVYQTTENQNITNIPNPVKEGYNFDGWYSDENYENEIEDLSEYLQSNSKSNITLYAKFSINQYTIAFNTNGGSTIAPITQNYNTAVTKPADPTRDGHTFAGWYTDDETFTNEYSFSTMPVDGVELYAKWENLLDSFIVSGTKITGLSDYGKSKAELIVPYNITEIGDLALRNGTFESIKFEDSNNLNKIGFSAFYECENLINVDLSNCNKLNNIDSQAFYRCSNLENISFDNCAENLTIGSYAFMSTKLKNVYLNNNVVDVGQGAFNCSVEKITLPQVFGDCLGYIFANAGVYVSNAQIPESLEEVVITNQENILSGFTRIENLITINLGACSNLKELNISAFNDSKIDLILPEHDFKISDSMFANCEINTISWKTEGTGYSFVDGHLQILEDFDFSNAEDWSYVKHDWYAFIKSVEFYTGITQLPSFRECVNLTEIEIPNTVTEIKFFNFLDCERLTNVIIPSSIEKIGESAFNGCKNLFNIDFSKCSSLTTIEECAFAYSGLKTVEIPSFITSIDSSAFLRCENLEAINIDENNINYYSQNGVWFNKDKSILIQYPQGREDIYYLIPESVKEISSSAFYECKALIDFINCVNLEKIGSYAFYRCDNIFSLDLRSTKLTTIGESAFNVCANLQIVKLPSTVTSIGKDAFGDLDIS